MDANELGRLFQRFRERHDLAALACVFDACAERLLGVARHLARDEASAEDLVQATFLVAIEQAERFERGRDFEAWLVGILTNKARQMHARGARSLDPERLPPRSVVDPAQDAALAEFVAELDRALARVPETYRAVLREHLANGRSPEEIARRLDRAPGTVRVQLHRGLAHLRRLLPAGFTAGLLATTARPRGIAAVREVVLSRAGEIAAATSVSGGAGVLLGVSMLNKKVVGACLLALVLAAVAFERFAASNTKSVEDAASPRTATTAVESSPPTVKPVSPIVTDGSTGERSVAKASDEACLEIEFVWADGTPAANVEIEVWPTHARDRRRAMRHATTDGSGHALFEQLLPGESELTTDRGRPEPKLVTCPSGTQTSLRCSLPRGIDVVGHVRDPQGRPIADASVGHKRPYRRHFGSPAVRTDREGRYVLRSLPSASAVFALAPGFHASEEKDSSNARPDVDGSITIDFVLLPGGARIEGFVTDPEGSPVVDAVVALHADNTTHFGAFVSMAGLKSRTDAVGRFEFAGLHATTGTVGVLAVGFAPTRARFEVGADEVKRVDLTLRVGASASGTVRGVTPEDAAPKYVSRSYEEEDPFGGLFASGGPCDTDGRFELDAIEVDAAGQVTLVATCRIDDRELFAETTLAAHDGELLHWDPVLDAGLAITGRVVSEHGAPLAGWRVYPYAEKRRSGAVRTNADGSFVAGGLEAARYTLYANEPVPEPGGESVGRTVNRGQVMGVAAGARDVVITILDSTRVTARVHGRLLDAEGKPFERAEVHLDGEGTRYSDSAKVRAEDGVFELGPVAAGTWSLCIEAPSLAYTKLAPFELELDEAKDLGDVRLTRPGTCELILRRKDGAKVEKGIVMLVDGLNIGHQLTSDDGELFRSEPLLPGTYRLQSYLPDVNVPPRSIEIRSGDVTKVELELETAVARQLLCTLPEGIEPPSTFFARVVNEKGREVAKWDGAPPTSERGPIFSLVAHVPAGPYTYECRAGDEWEARGSFHVLDLTQPHIVIQVQLKRRS